MTTVFPTFGTITDMEGMDANTKGNLFHEHRAWKCPHQFELLDEHSSTWATNGLISLHYKGMKWEKRCALIVWKYLIFLSFLTKKEVNFNCVACQRQHCCFFLFRAFEYLVHFDISFIRAILFRNVNKRSYLISLI